MGSHVRACSLCPQTLKLCTPIAGGISSSSMLAWLKPATPTIDMLCMATQLYTERERESYNVCMINSIVAAVTCIGGNYGDCIIVDWEIYIFYHTCMHKYISKIGYIWTALWNGHLTAKWSLSLSLSLSVSLSFPPPLPLHLLAYGGSS